MLNIVDQIIQIYILNRFINFQEIDRPLPSLGGGAGFLELLPEEVLYMEVIDW